MVYQMVYEMVYHIIKQHIYIYTHIYHIIKHYIYTHSTIIQPNQGAIFQKGLKSPTEVAARSPGHREPGRAASMGYGSARI